MQFNVLSHFCVFTNVQTSFHRIPKKLITFINGFENIPNILFTIAKTLCRQRGRVFKAPCLRSTWSRFKTSNILAFPEAGRIIAYPIYI